MITRYEHHIIYDELRYVLLLLGIGAVIGFASGLMLGLLI